MRAVLGNRSFWLFVVAYVGSAAYLAATGRPLGDVVGVLVILGLALPLLAIATCRGLPEPVPPQPWRTDDAATMLALLAWAVLFLAVKGPLLEALLPESDDPRLRDSVNTLLKLLAFVAIPAVVLRVRGQSWKQAGRPTAPVGRLLLCLAVVGAGFIAVQYLLGSESRRLLAGDYPGRHIVIGALLCLVWETVEAGIVEEYFFRWYLQSRLAAWTGSQVSAIFLASLVFGLAHAPGMWLRGAGVAEGLGSDPSLLTTVAYSVTTQGVAGLVFGVLWARTRSFWLVVALHGIADMPAHTAGFMDTWGL
jgi:membrane protease YdiL (CAAX protease family)